MISTTSTSYDSAGRAYGSTDENGLQSQTIYGISGNVIQTHEQAGDFKECEVHFFRRAGRLLVLFLSAPAKRQSLQSADRQWID